MSEEPLFEDPPCDAAVDFACEAVRKYRIDRFGSVVMERVPEKDGTLNGTRRIVSGLTLYLACKKLGTGFKCREQIVDDLQPELLYAVESQRIVDARRLAIAVKISDAARAISRLAQSGAGGDKKSAAAKAAKKQESVKTAFLTQESLSLFSGESDSGLKNATSQEDANSVNAVKIASDLTQIGTKTIEEGRTFRKKYPAIFHKMDRGEVKTFGQAKQLATEEVRRKRLIANASPDSPRIRRRAMEESFELIVGDNLKALLKPDLPRPTVIFCDVPYNNGTKYDGDPTGDNAQDAVYLANMERCARLCGELLADNGTMYVLTNARYQGRFDMMLRRIGLHWQNTIVWWGHFPKNMPGKYPEAGKFLHHFTKHKTRFIWHPPTVESVRNAIGDARGATAGKVPDNVWPILMVPGNSRDRAPFENMPPQLPVELPLRCILASSEMNDVILDPFCGNGTTIIASAFAGRRSIGIDRSALYIEQSRLLINDAISAGPSPYLKAIIDRPLVGEDWK